MDDEMARLRRELQTARETISRLNRRCQSAESGLAAKYSAGTTGLSLSLGRAFANAAATMYHAQLDEARTRLEALIAEGERRVGNLRRIADGEWCGKDEDTAHGRALYTRGADVLAAFVATMRESAGTEAASADATSNPAPRSAPDARG